MGEAVNGVGVQRKEQGELTLAHEGKETNSDAV